MHGLFSEIMKLPYSLLQGLTQEGQSVRYLNKNIRTFYTGMYTCATISSLSPVVLSAVSLHEVELNALWNYPCHTWREQKCPITRLSTLVVDWVERV